MEEVINISNKNKDEYDLIIIGGGPATISFFSYLFRNNYSEKIFPYTKILILEKSESFGSGCLVSYGINTNTSGEGFVRLICSIDDKSKINKLGLSPKLKSTKKK